MKTRINRPWIQFFSFRTALFSSTELDQLHKLSRNFVASLSLGCPSAVHVKESQRSRVTQGGITIEYDRREEYLAWVRDWKIIYRELSQIIRTLKRYRKTVHFPKATAPLNLHWDSVRRGSSNASPNEHLHEISSKHLERLQETAQVMLNARYNAKLAAAESRRRSLRKSVTTEQATMPELVSA